MIAVHAAVSFFTSGTLPPTGLTAYLREGTDPERVRSELLAAIGTGQFSAPLVNCTYVPVCASR